MEYRESRDWRAVDGGHRHRGDDSGSAPLGAGPELAQRKLTLQHFVAKFDVVPDMVGLTYNGFDILAGG